MGKLRDKSDAVLSQGIDDRGYWEPTGAPLRVYNWFYREASTTMPVRENFCHFWRIVLIWSPLLLGYSLLEKFFSSTVRTVVFLVAAVAILLYFGFTASWWVPGVPAMFVGVIAILTGLFALEDYFKDHHRLGGIVAGFILGIVGLGIVGLAGTLLWALIAEYGWAVLWYTLGALGAAAALIAVGILISVTFDYFNTKRKRKREIAINKAISEGLPMQVAYDTKTKRFFRNIGEFLVLIAQVVKVNKWKICPIVTIERPVDDYDYDHPLPD